MEEGAREDARMKSERRSEGGLRGAPRKGEPGTGGCEGDGRRRKKEFANSSGGCPENTLDVWRHFGSFFFSLFFVVVVSSVRAAPRCFCFFAHTNSSRAPRRARNARGERTGAGEKGTRDEGQAEESLRDLCSIPSC